MDKTASALVPYVGLKQEFAQRKDELFAAFVAIGEQAAFILRDDVTQFESAIAKNLGVRHAIGVNSGTDALFLALKALGIGPGDEVITVAHTFVATVAAIVHCGAKPVLVDIGEDFNMDAQGLEDAITTKTRAIIPVHMNGRCCDMPAILAVAEKHGLRVVEDAAQALGARISGQAAGNFGHVNAFSLHPMKNLHCFGDGGLMTTNDDALADSLRCLRNHGQNARKEVISFGFNSRMDNLQAALLNVNMQYFDADVMRRRELAARYCRELENSAQIRLPHPPTDDGYYDVFSSFPILIPDRDELAAHLRQRGIECFVHWETPLHRNEHLNLSGFDLPQTDRVSHEVLSLPIHPFLDENDCDVVISAIKEFYRGC